MFVNIISLIISTSLASPVKTPDLYNVTNQIRDHEVLQYGSWSIYAKDLENDRPLLDIEGKRCLIPASNLKLVTSAVALDLLGENHIMKTTLGHTGSFDSDGRLKGDLVIRGSGDPTLGSPNFDSVPDMDSIMAMCLRGVSAAGIHSIEGNIIADDSYLDHMPLPGAWSWTDIGNYYAAGTSGLTIHENLYYLYFKPALYVGGSAEVLRTYPVIPELQFFNHMRTGPVGSGDNGYIYGAPWQYLHQLEGTIPAGKAEFSIKGSIPDPAYFAALSIKNTLTNSGIPVSGKACTIRESGKIDEYVHPIMTIDSPPLKEIVYSLNKKSNNLYAELLLKIVAKEIRGSGDLETAINLVIEWLENKGIHTGGLFMTDGSGLSYLNRVSTFIMVDFLEKMTSESFFETFYASLPIAGDPDDPGTMSHMCRGTLAAGNLRAKTGSLPRVRAHSGYVFSRSGKLIAFSMIANDYTGSSGVINRLHEKAMVSLAELP